MITVVLLLRHSLICFLWRVVNFNSCIITEHQRDRNTMIINYGEQTQAQTGNPYTCFSCIIIIIIIIISHLSMSWVPLLYWGGLGLLRGPLLSLLCGDDGEASILRDCSSEIEREREF